MPQKAKEVMKRQKRRRSLRAVALPASLRLAAMLAVVGGAVFGAVLLWEQALTDPRFLMNGETLAMAGAVRECPESVSQIESIGKRFNGRSLLDPVLLTDFESAFEDSIWVKKITRMRRHFPNRIEVEFLIRMPAAQVRQNGMYWLIDAEASLLPIPGSKQPFPALPEIAEAVAGVIGKRPGEPGIPWDDPGVTGALGVMRAFWASPLSQVLPVERVVVVGGAYRDQEQRPHNINRRFEVVSTTGAVVRWGSFNAGDLDGELTSGEKLWNLQELLRREEANHPGVCFDVRTKLPGYSIL